MIRNARSGLLLCGAIVVFVALWGVATLSGHGGHAGGNRAMERGGAGGSVALVAPETAEESSRVQLSAEASLAGPGGDAGPDEVDESSKGPFLRGRVVTASAPGQSSRPIAGARVDYAFGQEFTFDLGERATSGFTDAEGRFEVPAEAWGSYPLTVAAEGFLPHSVKVGPVRSDLNLDDLPLAEAHVVSGRVVDQDGRGIEGAEILMDDPCSDDLGPYRWREDERILAVTDGRGAFTAPVLARSSPGAVWTLTAVHNSYRPAQHQGQMNRALRRPPPILITMDKGASIHGRVAGLDAAAMEREGPLVISVAPRITLENVVHDWDEDGSHRRVQVEPDGTFKVAGLRAGESVIVAVWTGTSARSFESRRRSEWQLVTATQGSDASAAVHLDFVAPARLRARVVDAAGGPLTLFAVDSDANAQIFAGSKQRKIMEQSVFPNGEVQWIYRAAEVEEPFEVTIEVQDEEGALLRSWRAEAPRLGAGGLHDFGEVVLEEFDPEIETGADAARSRLLRLRVLDAGGQPCAGASVDVAEASTERGSVLIRRATDEDGDVRVHVDAGKDLRVRVRSGLRWTSRADWSLREVKDRSPWTAIPAGEEPVSLTLVSPATASLDVTALYDGAPLPGAALRLCWIPPTLGAAGLRTPREATPEGNRTNGAGVWSHGRLCPGAWIAWVYHPQLRMPERFEFTLHPGVNSITLERTHTALEGRVVDADGQSIAGALVRAEVAAMSPLVAIHERDNYRLTPRLGGTKETVALRDIRYVRTDVDGAFRLDGVEPGRAIKALAMAPGFIVAESEHVTLQPGDTVDLGKLAMLRAGLLHILIPIGTDGDVNLQPVPDESGDEGAFAHGQERWASIFGEEVVDGLGPGDWTVFIEYRPSGGEGVGLTVQRRVTIREGETTQIDLRGP